MKPNEIIIVTGLPRCGSSLLMQMLSAAGLTCGGEFPSYEPAEMTQSPPPEYVDLFEGGALKLLDPHRNMLPSGRAYRFIFLSRSRRQQAFSIIKFAATFGGCDGVVTTENFERMQDGLRLDETAGKKEIHKHECPVMFVRFEDLIERSDDTIDRILYFLGISEKGVFEKMLACIRPRRAVCYNGFLELDLIREAEARSPSKPFDPLSCTCNFPGVIAPCGYCAAGDYLLPIPIEEPDT